MNSKSKEPIFAQWLLNLEKEQREIEWAKRKAKHGHCARVGHLWIYKPNPDNLIGEHKRICNHCLIGQRRGSYKGEEHLWFDSHFRGAAPQECLGISESLVANWAAGHAIFAMPKDWYENIVKADYGVSRHRDADLSVPYPPLNRDEP